MVPRGPMYLLIWYLLSTCCVLGKCQALGLAHSEMAINHDKVCEWDLGR